jgi:PTH1 family peptidyl-tRNA hydrolase
MRWMEAGPEPRVVRRLGSGTLYQLKPPFQALVPGTYMNLSGQSVAEAVMAGYPLDRMVLLHDDKDLPLGEGRFRLSGSDGGHNGLKSVFEQLGTQKLARLRLGIGPFERPLVEFVLGEWTEAEWARIEAMDESFAKFMEMLGASEDLGGLVGKAGFKS